MGPKKKKPAGVPTGFLSKLSARQKAALSKNHAAPQPRVPTESAAANNWCNHDRTRRYDHDRASVRAASSVRAAVKTGAAATLGTGAVGRDE